MREATRRRCLSSRQLSVHSLTMFCSFLFKLTTSRARAARGAYFQLLESGDHDTRSMAVQAFSDSGVDISVDEFLNLRHGISQPRNRHQHELADAEEFAEALENLQLDHKKKTLLTRLHVHELEADGHVFTSSRLTACNLPAVSAGTICMS